jgi:hypothetical protein
LEPLSDTVMATNSKPVSVAAEVAMTATTSPVVAEHHRAHPIEPVADDPGWCRTPPR